MTFSRDLHDRWARDRASFLICVLHGMLIGVVVLSFHAGDVPSPLSVMEGRNEEKAKFWWKMLRSNCKAEGKPRRGNMCSRGRTDFVAGYLLYLNNPHTVPCHESQNAEMTQGKSQRSQGSKSKTCVWRRCKRAGVGVSRAEGLASFVQSRSRYAESASYSGGGPCASK